MFADLCLSQSLPANFKLVYARIFMLAAHEFFRVDESFMFLCKMHFSLIIAYRCWVGITYIYTTCVGTFARRKDPSCKPSCMEALELLLDARANPNQRDLEYQASGPVLYIL